MSRWRSGGYIIENQHEEEIMRDIPVSKRGLEAALEEQPDRLRKNVRSEHEATNASVSSDPCVALKYPCEGRNTKSTCAEVKSFETISALDAFYRKGERVVTSEKCWIGIEAGDLERSE